MRKTTMIGILLAFRYLVSVLGAWLLIWTFNFDYNIFAVGLVINIAWNLFGTRKTKPTVEEEWNNWKSK